MPFTTADFVFACVAAAGLVLGGFAGFSGALAFVAASVAAFFVGRFGWPWSVTFFTQEWARGLAVLVAVLVVFGVVRALVRRLANLALKQPADFLFGALVGAVAAAALALAAAWGLAAFGILSVDSVILTGVRGLLAQSSAGLGGVGLGSFAEYSV